MRHLRLGVNIDHVATIRNARGHRHPDPVRAAIVAARAGANGITAHLREDRRHISDNDIRALKRQIDLPLNLEMAATEEMLAIALETKPHAVCLVPEKREELTTEGGLDVASQVDNIRRYVKALSDRGIRVSLFVDADTAQLEAAKATGAPVIEIHTGSYCEATGPAQKKELERIKKAVVLADKLKLECHAGHGLTYETVGAIAAIPSVVELNIGHFLVGEAIFVGFDAAIKKMRRLMDEARGK